MKSKDRQRQGQGDFRLSILDFGLRGKEKTIHFESDSWILTPPIENLNSKI